MSNTLKLAKSPFDCFNSNQMMLLNRSKAQTNALTAVRFLLVGGGRSELCQRPASGRRRSPATRRGQKEALGTIIAVEHGLTHAQFLSFPMNSIVIF